MVIVKYLLDNILYVMYRCFRLCIPVLVLVLLTLCVTVQALESPVFVKYRTVHIKQLHIGPEGTSTISGTLEPSGCEFYGSLTLDRGTKVRVKLIWLPDVATLTIGLYEVQTSNQDYEVVTGGYADVTFTTWVTGKYYLFICNESPYTVYYSGIVRIT